MDMWYIERHLGILAVRKLYQLGGDGSIIQKSEVIRSPFVILDNSRSLIQIIEGTEFVFIQNLINRSAAVTAETFFRNIVCLA